MRKTQITGLWSKVYKVSTIMLLSMSFLWVTAFVYQIVAIHWVESWRSNERDLNKRPIVGILAQEYHDPVTDLFNGSYIASSYVKAAESSGTRVVPIFIGKNLSYYEEIVDSINGVIFPGGGANLWDKGGYGEAANTLYKLIIEANRKGNHLPLFGICLGFEALPVVSTNMSKTVLENIDGTENIPLTLDFSAFFTTSSLYSSTPPELLNLLQSRNITANHHSKCFTPLSMVKHNLTDTWRMLSTSRLDGGKPFISSMEHAKYPEIFGTQFHPEKIPFEWTPENSDPHDYSAILANRWFFDHFARLARRNNNRFRSEKEEKSRLIYNFFPQYLDGYFEQIYRFESAAPVRDPHN